MQEFRVSIVVPLPEDALEASKRLGELYPVFEMVRGELGSSAKFGGAVVRVKSRNAKAATPTAPPMPPPWETQSSDMPTTTISTQDIEPANHAAAASFGGISFGDILDDLLEQAGEAGMTDAELKAGGVPYIEVLKAIRAQHVREKAGRYYSAEKTA